MNDIDCTMKKNNLEGKLEDTVSKAVVGFSLLETAKYNAATNRSQESYAQKIDYSKILSCDLDVVQEAGAYTLSYASAEQGAFSHKPFRINFEFVRESILDE